MKMRLKQAFSNLVILAWWAGPQHRDFRKESLQTKQVGDTTKLVFNFCPTPFMHYSPKCSAPNAPENAPFSI
ncbi:hypothetical protein CD127_09840 [Staphylococcus petrasii]|nr:hypothetical protein CD127_09840 [Staphylococcus petrasii]TGA80006.1 hypothetical protein E2554_11580 [Staphylococcus petrasii]